MLHLEDVIENLIRYYSLQLVITSSRLTHSQASLILVAPHKT